MANGKAALSFVSRACNHRVLAAVNSQRIICMVAIDDVDIAEPELLEPHAQVRVSCFGCSCVCSARARQGQIESPTDLAQFPDTFLRS